jgi:hypothetical protein
MQGISWLVDELLASQKVFCCMELGGQLFNDTLLATYVSFPHEIRSGISNIIIMMIIII